MTFCLPQHSWGSGRAHLCAEEHPEEEEGEEEEEEGRGQGEEGACTQA